MSEIIEVDNVKAINKGALLASCSVRIIPWQVTYHDVLIFEQGPKRWINLPSKEFVTDDNEVKYKELITFDTSAIKERFRTQIMVTIDKFLEGNPEMKPEDLIQEHDEIPF